MKIVALLATVVIAAVVAATPQTKPKNPILHLAPGKCRYSYCRGEKVKDLQWLLAGHRPNVFNKVKPTFKGKPNGLYGLRTARAVYAYKYRIGYPEKYNSKKYPIAGHDFFSILEGKEKRPAWWVALATKRLKATEASHPSRMALAIRLRELNEVGVTEYPVGSNYGPRVSQYQSVTGSYHSAWCMSFQQAMFKWSGYGTFADDTASVYYAVDYFATRNWLNAKPKVGALVFFVDYDSFGQRIPGSGQLDTSSR